MSSNAEGPRFTESQREVLRGVGDTVTTFLKGPPENVTLALDVINLVAQRSLQQARVFGEREIIDPTTHLKSVLRNDAAMNTMGGRYRRSLESCIVLHPQEMQKAAALGFVLGIVARSYLTPQVDLGLSVNSSAEEIFAAITQSNITFPQDNALEVTISSGKVTASPFALALLISPDKQIDYMDSIRDRVSALSSSELDKLREQGTEESNQETKDLVFGTSATLLLAYTLSLGLSPSEESQLRFFTEYFQGNAINILPLLFDPDVSPRTLQQMPDDFEQTFIESLGGLVPEETRQRWLEEYDQRRRQDEQRTRERRRSTDRNSENLQRITEIFITFLKEKPENLTIVQDALKAIAIKSGVPILGQSEPIDDLIAYTLGMLENDQSNTRGDTDQYLQQLNRARQFNLHALERAIALGLLTGLTGRALQNNTLGTIPVNTRAETILESLQENPQVTFPKDNPLAVIHKEERNRNAVAPVSLITKALEGGESYHDMRIRNNAWGLLDEVLSPPAASIEDIFFWRSWNRGAQGRNALHNASERAILLGYALGAGFTDREHIVLQEAFDGAFYPDLEEIRKAREATAPLGAFAFNASERSDVDLMKYFFESALKNNTIFQALQLLYPNQLQSLGVDRFGQAAAVASVGLRDAIQARVAVMLTAEHVRQRVSQEGLTMPQETVSIPADFNMENILEDIRVLLPDFNLERFTDTLKQYITNWLAPILDRYDNDDDKQQLIERQLSVGLPVALVNFEATLKTIAQSRGIK